MKNAVIGLIVGLGVAVGAYFAFFKPNTSEDIATQEAQTEEAIKEAVKEAVAEAKAAEEAAAAEAKAAEEAAAAEAKAAEEAAAAEAKAAEEAAAAIVAGRSTEDIRRTMDANKSAIQRIYDRALRKKPSLQGVVTPELVIEATGIVSSCSMAESTLNEPELESKICNRLLLVNFGQKAGVDQQKIRYPMSLLPS